MPLQAKYFSSQQSRCSSEHLIFPHTQCSYHSAKGRLWEWEMLQTFIFCKSHLSCGFGNYCKQHRMSSIVGEWKIGSDSTNWAWSPIYWKWSGIIKNSQLETSCGECYTLWFLWITPGNTHSPGFGLAAKTACATLMESAESSSSRFRGWEETAPGIQRPPLSQQGGGYTWFTLSTGFQTFPYF